MLPKVGKNGPMLTLDNVSSVAGRLHTHYAQLRCQFDAFAFVCCALKYFAICRNSNESDVFRVKL